MVLIAVVLMVAGAGLMAGAVLAHRRRTRKVLFDLIGRAPQPGREPETMGVLARRATDWADQAVQRVNQATPLGRALERARIPVRPGELVVIVACAGLGLSAAVLALTGSTLLAALGPPAAAGLAALVVRHCIARRLRAFERQLPDALSLIASSLAAGHTFLRAIQMMCEESGPPMSEEFSVVVAEARLGDSLVGSLERMAGRLQLRDFDIVVQAIAVQQTVGGRLAELLHTVADFIRARDEVRREVKVLTAEGRMSAYVLAGLVPFLFLVIRVLNPDYMAPMFSGIGLAILAVCGLSVLVGLVVILKMVTIDF